MTRAALFILILAALALGQALVINGTSGQQTSTSTSTST